MGRLKVLSSAGLAAGVFLLDTYTNLGSAFATLYCLVIVIASTTGSGRSSLKTWPILCVALTILSFAVVHGRHPDIAALLRMVISLAAIGVTTALMRHRKIMDDRLRREELHYEAVFNSLSMAIWEHDFRPVAAELKRLRDSGVTDLRTYLRNNPDFVIRTRRMVRITDANRSAISMMGFSGKDSFFGRLSDFLPESDESFADCLLAIDERREVFETETTVRTASGEPIDIIVTFSLAPHFPLDRVPGSILDITKRGQLERIVASTRAQLERAQRSASVAAMSAAIAHEINQPLAAIQNFVDTATRWLQRTPPNVAEALEALGSLRGCAQHAHEVVKRVRGLVRDSSGEMRELALRPLIEEIAKVARLGLQPGSRIVVGPLSDACTILGDRILLQQLFLNLINNAFQAMESDADIERGVHIMAENVGPDKVVLRVRDHGPGWDRSLRERAFESFYSTKTDGMGLGLAICQSIVEAHGGEIRLDNDVDRGAIVEITLPTILRTAQAAVLDSPAAVEP